MTTTTFHDYEATMIKVTNGVATAGILSPAWLPTLQEISSYAAALVPILSALWLAVQIVLLVLKHRRQGPRT